MNKFSYIILLCLCGILAACGQDPTPVTERDTVTPFATDIPAATETAVPTNTPAPTDTPAPTETPLPTETAVPTDTPIPTETAVPTATPEPTATIPSIPQISINQPQPDESIVTGQEITIMGQVNPIPPSGVDVQVVLGARSLVSGTVSVANTGEWLFTAPVTWQIAGPAQVLVQVPDEPDSLVTIEITLVPDETGSAAFVVLEEPAAADTAVAGYTLFFHGRSGNLIDDTLTIAVLTEACTAITASQSFTLVGGEWQGWVILPEGVTGDACAVAATGLPDVGAVAQVPITILDPEEEAATRLVIGTLPGATFPVTDTVTIFGGAVNAPNSQVLVTLALTGEETAVVSQLVPVDIFGFWQLDATLSPEVSGPATVTVTMGEGEDAITEEIDIILE